MARWPENRAADEAALSRVARGDHDALGELYDRHARPIYSLALRILQDETEAEDVVQEVFSQAWTQASRYDARRGAVAAWLLTLTRSRAIDRLRRRRALTGKTIGAETIADLPDQQAGIDRQMLAAEQVRRVKLALAELPMVQRVALELAYYEGLTQAEIAERLEQPLGTVKTRMRQALIKLRESLAGAV